MANTFAESESKVMSFMERVEQERLMMEEEQRFLQSDDYKLKLLNKCEQDGKEICLDKIFANIYKDAIPLNDEYKIAYDADLDGSFHDFMAAKCPKGLEYYVREGLRKKSPFAKKVLEAVDELVNDTLQDKAMNIEDTDPKDLVFDSNEDINKRLDVIGQDLSVPEITDAIRNNVKATAMSEITRAKKEKEELKELESELAQNINLTTEESVRNELELRGINQTRDYIPTLFEGIMINKLSKLQPAYESGELQSVYLYNVFEEYGRPEPITESGDVPLASLEDLAFVETVKEYTALSMLKALKLESYSTRDISEMAQAYAEAC